MRSGNDRIRKGSLTYPLRLMPTNLRQRKTTQNYETTFINRSVHGSPRAAPPPRSKSG